MKYVRFEGTDAKIRYGVLQDDLIRLIEGDLFAEYRLSEQRVQLSQVKLLAPCMPGKVVGVGANYHSQLRSKGKGIPSNPKIFLKPSGSVIGPGDAIVCPNIQDRIIFEGELGVVIGKRCKGVARQDALDYVFGYTCLNDVTDFTMLEADTLWDRGKGADTFCPIGPVISDEINPFDVMLESWVDGDIRQCESTAGMVFDVPSLIAFISRDITLFPGDVIASGSPAGMGPMFPGQTVCIDIHGIGVLQNTMISKG